MLGELPHSKATKEEPAQTLKSLALFPYLRSSSDHVLNEVSVSRGINDGDVVLACFEFPKGNINGDTTLTLSFQLVQDPGVFEGTFAHLQIKKKKKKNYCVVFSIHVFIYFRKTMN